jgi:hypothetical protein
MPPSLLSSALSIDFFKAGFDVPVGHPKGIHRNDLVVEQGNTLRVDITEFDGQALAGSDKFEDYYGFRGEGRHFLDRIMNQGDKGDPERTAEDCATMELCEAILAARIP